MNDAMSNEEPLTCPDCGRAPLTLTGTDTAEVEAWPGGQTRQRFIFECPAGHRVEGPWSDWIR